MIRASCGAPTIEGTYVMNTEHQDELARALATPSWSEFWGEGTEESIAVLDNLCWQLAVRMCEQQCQNALIPNHRHGPQRNDGRPCDACYDTAFVLLRGILADTFRAFGTEAYCVGIQGVSEQVAATRAVMAIGNVL